MKISIRPQQDEEKLERVQELQRLQYQESRRFAGLTLEEENDTLTWVELREQGLHTARITCHVCGLPSTVAVTHPALLCSACLCDLFHTRQHVEHCLAAVEVRWRDAVEAFDAQVDSADEATQQRWEAVEGARGTPLFAQAWNHRRSERSAFGELLRAYESLEALTLELERWRAAMTEVEIAEGDTPAGQVARYRERRQKVMIDGKPVYGWWLRWQKRVTGDVTEEQIRKEAAAAAKLQSEVTG